MKIILRIKTIFFLTAFVVLSAAKIAQTNTYTGPSGGEWNTAGNWSLSIVLTASHDVVIPARTTVVVDNHNTVANSEKSDNENTNQTRLQVSGLYCYNNN